MEQRKIGLLGFPVSHSLSPAIFRELARLLGRRVDYRALAVAPSGLKAAVEGLRRQGWAGFNVTIPHKKTVIPLLDGLTPQARAIGAVNAARVSPRGLRGHNTDAMGLADALAAARMGVKGKDAVVFGAGGAARAVGYALGRLGAARVVIAARRPAQARELAAALSRLFPRTAFSAGRPRDAWLWVNATPLGMAGFPRRSPAPRGLRCAAAYDLVYGRDTPFLKQARAQGARAEGGLSMLVFQALRAWEFWFGRLGGAERARLFRAIVSALSTT